MSRSFLLLFSLFLGITQAVGSSGSAADMTNISVSGTVERAKGKEVKLRLEGYVPGQPEHTATFKLDDSDSFTFVAYIREPLIGQLYFGKEVMQFYVEPGAQLQLRFDAKKPLESLQFSGDLSQENLLLAAYGNQYGLSLSALQEYAQKLTPAAYVAWVNQRKAAQERHLQAQAGLSPTFTHMVSADINYGWANELYAYAKLHSADKRQKYQLPADFYAFADEVQLHNYDVIGLESYRQFLRNYLEQQYQVTYNLNPTEDQQYFNHMYTVAQQNLRAKPRYHMQAEYLFEAITYLGLDAVSDEYIEFANECPVQEYKNQLHELIKMQNVFEEAKPVVAFTTKTGEQLKLEELKGQVVLIRFDRYENQSTTTEESKARDAQIQEQLKQLSDKVTFVQLDIQPNRKAYESMVYADANEYLKSIINRPKPGQKVELPAWSYVVLNRQGLVVSNSLDDPNNELALEKVKMYLSQEEQALAD